MAHFPCFLSPLADSPLLPFAPLSNPSLLTWNPPCCDRIHPPRSQVACKLTSPFSTLSPIPPPSKFPEPRSPSTLLRRPQESDIFCPEHLHLNSLTSLFIGNQHLDESFLKCLHNLLKLCILSWSGNENVKQVYIASH
jgi:hypothetical protein